MYTNGKPTGSDFNYEVQEKIEILSTYGDTTKELRLISYNGSKPKYDIRNWNKADPDNERMLKGITLSLSEARKLKEALNARSEI